MKIRYQLTFLFTTIVASFLFVFCLAVYFFYSQFREREFYSRLRVKAVYTAEIWNYEKDAKKLFQLMYEMRMTSLFGEQIQIIKDWNKPEYESSKAEQAISKQQFDYILNGKELRFRKGDREIVSLLYRSSTKGNVVIVISAIDKFGWSKLDTLYVILGTGWFLSVFFVMLAGYFFAGNILHPINEIIQEVGAVSATNLEKKLSDRSGKDEISQLSRTFNDLLIRLEDAFKMQKNFVSNASHEIRNPLASMKAQLDVTLLKERPKEEYEEVLKSLVIDINRMIKIANGLLELAKVSGDLSMIKFTTCRIDDIVMEAGNSVMRFKPEYQVTFDYEQVPEYEEDVCLTGSKELLFSAFYNIIENGCKYSDDHKIVVKLNFSQYDIVIQFQDHGIGISQSDRKKIFEPFFRSEEARSYTGIGLGLSLVQKIIHQHRGKVAIISEPGHGTLVTVRLNKRNLTF